MNPRQRRTAIAFAPLTWLTGAFGAMTKGLRPLMEAVRSLAQQRTAAEETAKALATLPKRTLPKRTLRQLTVITARCLGNELLVRVARIPPHLPGARYDRYLVIPTSATTFQYGDQRITARAGFLGELDSFDVQCRCHPRPVTLTPQQLRGEAPPAGGIRVRGVLKLVSTY